MGQQQDKEEQNVNGVCCGGSIPVFPCKWMEAYGCSDNDRHSLSILASLEMLLLTDTKKGVMFTNGK